MKLPQISLQTLLAITAVVAIDCMICHSVATRPRRLFGELDEHLCNALPMANLLAIAIGLWIHRGKMLGSFWPGFTILGSVALGVSAVWLDRIGDLCYETLWSPGVEAWISQSSTHEIVVEYGVYPLLLLLPQLVVGIIGGFCTRFINKPSITAIEVATPRRRLAALLAMVAVVTVPAIGVEGYLVVSVDRKIARLPVNSDAELTVEWTPGWHSIQNQSYKSYDYPGQPAKPIVAGSRVRVIQDDKPSLIGNVIVIKTLSVLVAGDTRPVRVVVLGGEGPVGTASIPYCALRPIKVAR